MTLQPVTITEEVVVKGEVVTQTRQTLQLVKEPTGDQQGNQAMSVNHPDFIPATERVYTYNEATGMSDSAPRTEVVEDQFPEDTSEPDAEALCLHPIGSGECQLPAGHAGSHKLYVD